MVSNISMIPPSAEFSGISADVVAVRKMKISGKASPISSLIRILKNGNSIISRENDYAVVDNNKVCDIY